MCFWPLQFVLLPVPDEQAPPISPCLDNLTHPSNDNNSTTYYVPGIDYFEHYIYYLCEGGTIIISLLQIRKLGHCEVK